MSNPVQPQPAPKLAPLVYQHPGAPPVSGPSPEALQAQEEAAKTQEQMAKLEAKNQELKLKASQKPAQAPDAPISQKLIAAKAERASGRALSAARSFKAAPVKVARTRALILKRADSPFTDWAAKKYTDLSDYLGDKLAPVTTPVIGAAKAAPDAWRLAFRDNKPLAGLNKLRQGFSLGQPTTEQTMARLQALHGGTHKQPPTKTKQPESPGISANLYNRLGPEYAAAFVNRNRPKDQWVQYMDPTIAAAESSPLYNTSYGKMLNPALGMLSGATYENALGRVNASVPYGEAGPSEYPGGGAGMNYQTLMQLAQLIQPQLGGLER